MSHGLFSALRSGFSTDPNKPAFTLADGSTITYGQLTVDTARIANMLMSMGIRAGDRVVVQTEKSAAVILLYLATQRIGAVYVPLNTAYTKAEVEYFLGDATPKLFAITHETKSR